MLMVSAKDQIGSDEETQRDERQTLIIIRNSLTIGDDTMEKGFVKAVLRLRYAATQVLCYGPCGLRL